MKVLGIVLTWSSSGKIYAPKTAYSPLGWRLSSSVTRQSHHLWLSWVTQSALCPPNGTCFLKVAIERQMGLSGHHQIYCNVIRNRQSPHMYCHHCHILSEASHITFSHMRFTLDVNNMGERSQGYLWMCHMQQDIKQRWPEEQWSWLIGLWHRGWYTPMEGPIFWSWWQLVAPGRLLLPFSALPIFFFHTTPLCSLRVSSLDPLSRLFKTAVFCLGPSGWRGQLSAFALKIPSDLRTPECS